MKLSQDWLIQLIEIEISSVDCMLFYSAGFIQFEGSGNWPDDLIAIQHIRTAFHIKVAECIRKELHLPARATSKWIDIFKVRAVSSVNFFPFSRDNVSVRSGFSFVFRMDIYFACQSSITVSWFCTKNQTQLVQWRVHMKKLPKNWKQRS